MNSTSSKGNQKDKYEKPTIPFEKAKQKALKRIKDPIRVTEESFNKGKHFQCLF